MAKEKVVLAYSGGLDTSVAVKWLTDKGYDVIAVGLDVGEGKDLEFVKQKALQVGAIQSYTIDAKKSMLNHLSCLRCKHMPFMSKSILLFRRYHARSFPKSS